MEDEFPNTLKRELNDIFSVSLVSILSSGSAVLLPFGSSTMFGDGSWEPGPPPKYRVVEVPPNPLYMELFE